MILKMRFTVMGAPTMMDLVSLMNKHAHPLQQLKYIGPNGGDYSGYLDQEKIEAAKYIAIFDAMPTPITDMGEMEMIDSLDEVSDESNVVLSA